MHFNELLLNFRLKALGALTIVGGLVGSLLLGKSEGPPPRVNLFVFAGAAGFLALVWIGLWIIDAFYYRRLLRGAVRDAIRLEGLSDGLIRLSTIIEEEVEGARFTNEKILVSVRAGRWFYGLPLAGLVIAAAAMLCAASDWDIHPDAQQRRSTIEKAPTAPPAPPSVRSANDAGTK